MWIVWEPWRAAAMAAVTGRTLAENLESWIRCDIRRMTSSDSAMSRRWASARRDDDLIQVRCLRNHSDVTDCKSIRCHIYTDTRCNSCEAFRPIIVINLSQSKTCDIAHFTRNIRCSRKYSIDEVRTLHNYYSFWTYVFASVFINQCNCISCLCRCICFFHVREHRQRGFYVLLIRMQLLNY